MRLIAQSVASAGQPAWWGGSKGVGWQAETPARGAPIPSPTPKRRLWKTVSGEPRPDSSPPVLGPASPHITTFCPISGSSCAFGGLALCAPLPTCLTRPACLAVCPPFACLFGCVTCFFLYVCLSDHLAVPAYPSCISLSICLLSACSPGLLFFFTSPSPPFCRSTCHPSTTLSSCPQGSCLSPLLTLPESSHQPRLSLSNTSIPVTLLSAHCLQGPPSVRHLSLSLSDLVPVSMSFPSLSHSLFLNQGLNLLPAYFYVPFSSPSLYVSTCQSVHISLCVLVSAANGVCPLCLPFPGFLDLSTGPISVSTRGQQVQVFQVGRWTGWLRSFPASPNRVSADHPFPGCLSQPAPSPPPDQESGSPATFSLRIQGSCPPAPLSSLPGSL